MILVKRAPSWVLWVLIWLCAHFEQIILLRSSSRPVCEKTRESEDLSDFRLSFSQNSIASVVPEPAVNSEVNGKGWKASSLRSYCPSSKEIHVIEYVSKTPIYFFSLALKLVKLGVRWPLSSSSLTASTLPLSQESAFSPENGGELRFCLQQKSANWPAGEALADS